MKLKIRILENSGWTFIYRDGLIYKSGCLCGLSFISKTLFELGLIKDGVEINDGCELDRIIEILPDVKQFVFTDDDYDFTPFSIFKKLDPLTREKFDDVAKYLLTEYEYRQEEYDDIIDFIF